MRLLFLALLLASCGDAQEAASRFDFDSEKGLVAEYGALSCTEFQCGKKVYTLPDYPVSQCIWGCALHKGEWESVRVDFRTKPDGCYAEIQVTTETCLNELAENMP